MEITVENWNNARFACDGTDRNRRLLTEVGQKLFNRLYGSADAEETLLMYSVFNMFPQEMTFPHSYRL